MGHSPARRQSARLLRAATAMVALTTLFTFRPAEAKPPPPRPNPVLEWDRIAQDAIFTAEAPYVTDNGFAMVNAAVYDAVNAISGTPYRPYLVAPPATGGESVDAAVATAAFKVLAWLYPPQLATLQPKYDAALAKIPDGRSKRRGIAVGEATSAAMITARTNDGRYGPATWRVGTEPGQWRPTPPDFGSDGAWLGHMKPFAITSPEAYHMEGPPALTSAQYTRDYQEVLAVGGANSTVRTADQTEAALFWNTIPLTDWEMKRDVARNLNVLDAARLFALGDVARADAHIACFNEKDFWSFWRPVTAIHEAANDGNPDTQPDPTWDTPQGFTPPFPDYPSGHACATVANMRVNQIFFGRDRHTFSATASTGATRRYTRFSQAATEVANARVWVGIHFRTAVVDGSRLGNNVADYVAAHYFTKNKKK